MIELYSTNIAVTNGQTITWDAKSVQRGSSVTIGLDGKTISLNAPGVYELTLSINGQTTAEGTLGVSVQGDGNAITRATYSVASAAATATGLSFDTLIAVSGVYGSTDKANITVTYTGGAGTLSLIDMVVKKVYGA